MLTVLRRGGLASTSWGVTTPVAGTSRCSEVVSGGQGKEKWRNGTTTFVVVRFRDAPCGPPTSWVSPAIPPSHIRPSSEIELAHIPQKRGGAHMAGFCGVERGGTARLTVWVDEGGGGG